MATRRDDEPPPTAEPPASFLRVRTKLCENLTLPGWDRMLMEEQRPLLHPPVQPHGDFPGSADFAHALRKENDAGQQLPQTIAHRGYKAKFPENTMGAFVGAVEVGAHAIETDVHLTKDGVVVLNHDPSLERCFGVKEKVIDCDWEYLSTLRTLAEPHERLPRLSDLLEYIAKPGNEHVWVLLDIKAHPPPQRDNDLDDVMRLISETIASVPPAPSRPWNQRIVLGIWAAKYLPFISTYLPDFPLTYISFSLPCAWYFLTHVPRISFNLYAPILAGPLGAAFRRRAQGRRGKGGDGSDDPRPVFAWTVNKERMMRWSIQKGLDGVVTDDPKRFLDECERWKGKKDGDGNGSAVTAAPPRGRKRLDEVEGWVWRGWGVGEVLDLLRVQLFILVLTPILLWWLRPWGAVREVGKMQRGV
ncbi:glycerophosphoryl diester phosphodiesterase [Diplodia corticola]|uniref:Glycerophosphoryl diester phosphodiesterase n=1 Tax=Diplodia corticola TaxID=236234 RepID=A0A1J9RP28_9PEZI|nr:glycerophosphoryl diester phosphodiesterase [Diplodia corticola]OJD34307.1 glycerophosphoryl diester phosphodiesterase [Diplodia corticola]